jgi:hypothetical protein
VAFFKVQLKFLLEMYLFNFQYIDKIGAFVVRKFTLDESISYKKVKNIFLKVCLGFRVSNQKKIAYL